LLQRAEALPGAILDEQLETAGRAEALHGRRWDDEDAGLVDVGQTPLQRRDELVGRRPVPPLVPRLRPDEDGPRVGAVRACGPGEPRERDRELDPRRGEDDVASPPYDGIGPLERCP